MKQTIGKFLATLRKAKGLTQEEVADRLNISNKTLSSWETDRTTPDALTLPAIADLYEVTVDEILRGERAKSNEQAQISEKAKQSLIKKKYGKFSVKHFMFTAFGLLAIALNILGFAFLVYTGISEWVGILLSVIGFCGAVTLTILLIFFEYTTLLSEGILEGSTLSESAEEEMKRNGNSLALCVKRKNSISLKLFSLPYLLFALATLLYFIVEGGEYTVTVLDVSVTVDRTSVYIGFLCAAAVIGAAYLIWGICSGVIAVTKYGDESQRALHKKNKKRFSVLSIVCASVVTVSCIVAVVFSCITVNRLYAASDPNVEETKIHTTNFEEFRELSQTLILDDETVARFDLPSNQFVLKLPEDFWQNNRQEWWGTDLGNGFYGSCEGVSVTDLYWHYTISYKQRELWDEDTGEEYDVYYPVAHGTLVKVYHDEKKRDYDYIIYLPIGISVQYIGKTEDGELTGVFDSSFLIRYKCGDFVGKNYATGEYGLFLWKSYCADRLAWFCFVMIAVAALGVCAIVYVTKRKKLIYKI